MAEKLASKYQFYYRAGHWFKDTDLSIPLIPSIDLGMLRTERKTIALRFGWLGFYFLIGIYKN